MIKVYRGDDRTVFEHESRVYQCRNFSFDALFQSEDPAAFLAETIASLPETAPESDFDRSPWLPPVENQEIWAAGVTYFRSREARMEEAEATGGDAFYDLVYEAERPELFFKATARRARGHGAPIRIRADSTWDVPEPELTIAVNSGGKIFGYTVGNDVSSRSIEGANPLYLPQAKLYTGSCALGPALLVGPPLPRETPIELRIRREETEVFQGATALSGMKRGLEELAGFLLRDNDFPAGAYLMTGTGVVPEAGFTLRSGDIVEISIPPIGTLSNTVE